MSSTRRFRRAVYARRKRNSERIIRSGYATVGANEQSAVYTYTAAKACVAKNIKLDLGVATHAGAYETALPYVLVVVREGYNPNLINYPAITNDLYNPTMDVLISGCITDASVEDHKSNYIGRKLKAGDRLCLIVYNATTSNAKPFFETSLTIVD